jgi:L-glyceraldehyde reductase
MSFKKTLALSSGAQIPQIGLGTWQSKPLEVMNAVEHAVRHGYRHLDLAMIYENQDEVGAALKKVIPSVVNREDLWITSKVWNTSHQPDQVEKELDETLKQLGIEYLDLYLIHWPVAFKPSSKPGTNFFPPDPKKEGWVELDLETSLVDTWKAMIAVQKTGKVKHIGVSNFSIEAMETITKVTGVKPEVNQVEAHPYLPQNELAAYCDKEGIHITAYSPLGNNSIGKPRLTEQPVVVEIAKELGATPAQVLVAWGAHRGWTVIPKSVQNARIESNFQQVELSQDVFDKITKLGDGNYTRFNIPYRYSPQWDISIFDEPEEKEATHKVKIQ